MEIKTEVLFYNLINSFPNQPEVFIKTVELFDEKNNVVGNLQATVSYFKQDQIPIYLLIATPKGCICYNYGRVEELPIITKATYSSGYQNVIVKREYLTRTLRKLTITYTD